MSRSNQSHRLTNKIFNLAIRRKIFVDIPGLQGKVDCWCRNKHNRWGIHSYSCAGNNKKIAHNLIKYTAAAALQCILAQGEYILPTTELEIKLLGICPSNANIKPFDLVLTLNIFQRP